MNYYVREFQNVNEKQFHCTVFGERKGCDFWIQMEVSHFCQWSELTQQVEGRQGMDVGRSAAQDMEEISVRMSPAQAAPSQLSFLGVDKEEVE